MAKHKTLGHAMLAALLEGTKQPKFKTAQALGWDPSALSRVARGQLPNLKQGFDLMDEGIPLCAWFLPVTAKLPRAILEKPSRPPDWVFEYIETGTPEK